MCDYYFTRYRPYPDRRATAAQTLHPNSSALSLRPVQQSILLISPVYGSVFSISGELDTSVSRHELTCCALFRVENGVA